MHPELGQANLCGCVGKISKAAADKEIGFFFPNFDPARIPMILQAGATMTCCGNDQIGLQSTLRSGLQTAWEGVRGVEASRQK